MPMVQGLLNTTTTTCTPRSRKTGLRENDPHKRPHTHTARCPRRVAVLHEIPLHTSNRRRSNTIHDRGIHRPQNRRRTGSRYLGTKCGHGRDASPLPTALHTRSSAEPMLTEAVSVNSGALVAPAPAPFCRCGGEYASFGQTTLPLQTRPCPGLNAAAGMTRRRTTSVTTTAPRRRRQRREHSSQRRKDA